MAAIFKRRLKDGKGFTWRAVIRIKGFPTTCESFERKQEAEDWAKETERRIRLGQYNYAAQKQQHTYADLSDRLHTDGVLQHQRSLKNTRSQFEHWKQRLGEYALVHITPELIGKERQHLSDMPTPQGKKRTPATINRYMAVLSSTLGYAAKQLRWINDNPCANILKLKEDPGRDRILNDDEIARLLAACKMSKSPYLYCIVLIALTTGARRGEILSLEWRHVDFENRLAYFKETKNGRPRSVALTDPVIAELKKLRELRNPSKPLVFASKTAFGRIDIKKSWYEALRRADISDYHFHDTRHQFCTAASRLGASNVELATAMGHATLSCLLRYTTGDVRITKKYSQSITQRILNLQEDSM